MTTETFTVRQHTSPGSHLAVCVSRYFPHLVQAQCHGGTFADVEATAELIQPRHTVRGQTSEDGWPYGQTHDFDCPACLANGTDFLASPRSETYWSS